MVSLPSYVALPQSPTPDAGPTQLQAQPSHIPNPTPSDPRPKETRYPGALVRYRDPKWYEVYRNGAIPRPKVVRCVQKWYDTAVANTTLFGKWYSYLQHVSKMVLHFTRLSKNGIWGFQIAGKWYADFAES